MTEGEWHEPFLIRTVGGPAPGTRVSAAGEYDWPLPPTLNVPGETGRYVKKSESQLPAQAPDSHVVRGAEYEWRAA